MHVGLTKRALERVLYYSLKRNEPVLHLFSTRPRGIGTSSNIDANVDTPEKRRSHKHSRANTASKQHMPLPVLFCLQDLLQSPGLRRYVINATPKRKTLKKKLDRRGAAHKDLRLHTPYIYNVVNRGETDPMQRYISYSITTHKAQIRARGSVGNHSFKKKGVNSQRVAYTSRSRACPGLHSNSSR